MPANLRSHVTGKSVALKTPHSLQAFTAFALTL